MLPYLKKLFHLQLSQACRQEPLPKLRTAPGSGVCWDGSLWCSFQRKEEQQQGSVPFPDRCHRAPNSSHSVPCVFQTHTEAALMDPAPTSLISSPQA